MSYSVEERLQLYECYIRNNRNSLLALREYRTLHPNNRVPTKQIFSRILRDLANGVVVNKGRNRPKNVLTEEKQLEILLYFEENNETSQRTAELDIDNVSRRSIGRALDMHGYHPYKFTLVQELHAGDPERRLAYCSLMMEDHFQNSIFQNILWTDEATFNTSGVFNRKNTHYWSSYNKHLIKPIQRQGRQSVNVWCGIIRDRVIGPIFYDRTLNGARYLNLLTNEIWPIINQLPVNLRDNLVFQQDSAPCHTVAPVREFLNQHFRTWIGKHGTIDWPARSPDLTPLDYFLWGTLKDEVYKNRSNNEEDLKIKIREKINRINQTDAVRKAIDRLEILYTSCIAVEGNHIEHLL